MGTDVYTTADVIHITGFTARQIDYWSQQGVVTPSVQQSHGPGTRRLYALTDLVQLRFVSRLKADGWSTQKIRKAVTTLRNVMNDPHPLRNAVLLHSKGSVIALCKTKEGERVILDALNAGGQQVLGIVLEILEEETRCAATDCINSGPRKVSCE